MRVLVTAIESRPLALAGNSLLPKLRLQSSGFQGRALELVLFPFWNLGSMVLGGMP